MKAALYLRVSTAEQHAENQLPELARYVAARGWTVCRQYVDQGVSGAKASRPALDAMMADARRLRFDTVVVWSFSRFGRNMVASVLSMHELNELEIRLISIQEGIDTGTIIGRGVAALLLALAEQQLYEIREKVKAGVRRARAQGKRWGAPKRHLVPVAEVEQRLAAGESLAGIARALKVPKTTVHRQLADARQRTGNPLAGAAASARNENPPAGCFSSPPQ